MAARSDAATDRVSIASAPVLTTVTVMAWAKVVNSAAPLFHQILRISAGGGSALIFGFKGTNGRTPSLYSGSSSTGINGSEVPLGTWVFAAATMSSGAAGLLQGITPGSLSKVSGTVNTTGTPDGVTLFSRSVTDGTEWLDGSLAYVRIYTAVLSDAEIAAESLSPTAVRTSGLWAHWPLSGASLADTSGNGRTLIAGTTALTADTDPPISSGSGAKIYNGTSWVDSGMPRIYSGSAWVTAAKARAL